MKELSIEQKAKAYDEAIKKAKSKIKNDKDHVLYEDDIIEIFPELKESEDERIRKALITYFGDEDESYDGIPYPSILAWLEKQSKASKVEQAMREVEEKAEAYPVKIAQREGYDENLRERKGFIKGYKQAEKDLELIWEDVRKIVIIYENVLNDKDFNTLPIKDGYTEVLKRFKEQKGKEV